jgi:hypothetical protein
MKIKKQYSLRRNRSTTILENADVFDEKLLEAEILQDDWWEPPIKAESCTRKSMKGCTKYVSRRNSNYSSRHESVRVQRKSQGTVNRTKLDRVVHKEVALWQELAQKVKTGRMVKSNLAKKQKIRNKRMVSAHTSIQKIDTNKLVLLS